MATSSYKTVPLSVPDQAAHLRMISIALNNTIGGKINSTGSLTTANASTAFANLYVSARVDGSATLTHASSANVDQTFGYVVFG